MELLGVRSFFLARNEESRGTMQTAHAAGVRALEWTGTHLRLLDQARLPHEVRYLELQDWREVVEAVRALSVRGAPALGVAGAYAVVLAARELAGLGIGPFREGLLAAADGIARARPTAVNLAWGVSRALRAADEARTPAEAVAALVAEAAAILDEDVAANRAIGAHGAALVPTGATLLTHCNTGSLATAGHGTALGIVRTAWAEGRLREVIATETRPLLQGARLTAWELSQDGIPVTVVVDSAAGALLRGGCIEVVVVGADRIAANGDVANKIGTYSLAVLARANGVPFYVAAPTTTVDLETQTGDGIPIEERPGEEVEAPLGTRATPPGVAVLNPAFDVTPAEYVTAIVTEAGIARPPYRESLAGMVAHRG